jgi:hypothetical protein
MRSFALAGLLALLPSTGRAQLAPRSVALEVGFRRESLASLGDQAPVALAASWWIADGLDLEARVSFAAVVRTGGRAADDLYEAGLGLRRVLGAGALRPFAAVDLAFLQASTGPLLGWEQGVRLGASAGVEAFVAGDLSLAAAAQACEALLSSGSGTSLGVILRATVYF